jgi:hypothetical protein
MSEGERERERENRREREREREREERGERESRQYSVRYYLFCVLFYNIKVQDIQINLYIN